MAEHTIRRIRPSGLSLAHCTASKTPPTGPSGVFHQTGPIRRAHKRRPDVRPARLALAAPPSSNLRSAEAESDWRQRRQEGDKEGRNLLGPSMGAQSARQRGIQTSRHSGSREAEKPGRTCLHRYRLGPLKTVRRLSGTLVRVAILSSRPKGASSASGEPVRFAVNSLQVGLVLAGRKRALKVCLLAGWLTAAAERRLSYRRL